jgi:hypothetical protein
LAVSAPEIEAEHPQEPRAMTGTCQSRISGNTIVAASTTGDVIAVQAIDAENGGNSIEADDT